MQMSDHEILYEYTHAVNRRAQIGVLADLNDVSLASMHQKLQSLGAEDLPPLRDLPAPIPMRKTVSIDETRAMQLYNEGMCDLDLAEALGVGRKAVADWRQKNGLKIHRQKPVAKSAETSGYMRADGLLRVAHRMQDTFPQAEITAAGSHVCDIRVHIRYGADGDVVSAEMELILEDAT